ncbi:hypothetical protein CBL_11149 [Carabus blaptoides fortunei]
MGASSDSAFHQTATAVRAIRIKWFFLHRELYAVRITSERQATKQTVGCETVEVQPRCESVLFLHLLKLYSARRAQKQMTRGVITGIKATRAQRVLCLKQNRIGVNNK